MKRHCIESARVQDFLDDLLEAPEAEAFRRHLEDCAACAAEVVAYQRVFQSIAHAPRLDPGPVFTERVLEAVVPARIRRRWLRTVGWSYAGSLAASVAAAGLVASFPGSRAWFEGASAAVPQHAVQLAVFVFNALGFATLSLANGWGALASLGTRIAPLPRAFAMLLQHPPIEVALWAAAVICVLVLASLRAGQRPSRRGGPLAILGA